MPAPERRAPVPKFSSFKPAVKRPVDAERQQAPVKRRRSSSPGSERTHHHRRHRNEPGRHARPPDAFTPDQASIRHESPTDDHLYMIDRKGDPQNWTYQRLHKYAIPHYYRTGYGNVLGLEHRIKIDRETSVEDKIYLIDTRRLPALSKERSLLKRPKLNHISELRIDSRLHDQSFDSTTDFIPLRSVRPLTRCSAPSSKSDFLLEIKALHKSRPSTAKPADADLVYASSDSENGTSDLDAATRQRTIELSRRTKTEPASLEAWLDLIAHQERLLRPANPPVVLADLSNSERRSLADLRLHIFEKASKCIPIHDKSARETLFHAMFQEASIVWDLPKYTQSLRDAIRELPASFLLWTMYLGAAQTKPIGFRFEEGKAFFLESLQSMRAACPASRTPPNEEIQDMHLYILLRYTTYLWEAGYSELSIGLWQGLIEFHLFRPDLKTGTDLGPAVQCFEKFWESEIPRFGEHNSQGWRNNVSRDAEPAGDMRTVEQQALSPRRPFNSFAISEEKLSHTLPFPGRTSEETASGDPFHIIFFSDIKDVLEATPFQFLQRNLVDAFLCYLGLPARPSITRSDDHASRVQAWQSDPFLSGGLMEGISTGSSSITQPSIPHFVQSTQTLFSESYFPRQSAVDARLCRAPDHTISELSENGTSTLTDHILLFARSSLASLVNEYSDDEALAEYFLAYECHYFPKEASKTARATLKRRPSSLRLYNACAMVESKLGNPEKASRIWGGAIKMKDSFAPEAQQEAVLLWHSWTWSEMQRGELHAAMSRLLSFDGEFEQAPATYSRSTSATLRVKKVLKEGFDHALSQRNAQLTSLNVECLALLGYLNNTAADALSAAIGEVHEYCTMIHRATNKASTDIILELLHQAKARIIAYHIKQRGLYKPAFVRSELEVSINLFPSNTIFLWLYKENEARFRIDDRVRAVLKDSSIANRRSALIGFTFAVDQELSRFAGQASGSTAESVRATFARALLSNESTVRHSKALWARWLRFEEQAVQQLAAEKDLDKRVGKQTVKKWKEVFLGGLHHLPWVKEWVMIGLRCFDSEQDFGWSKRDLKGLYNVLQERELRIRVEGLDDLLGDMDDMQ